MLTMECTPLFKVFHHRFFCFKINNEEVYIPTVDSWSTFLGSAMYNITPEKLTKTNKMKNITTFLKHYLTYVHNHL